MFFKNYLNYILFVVNLCITVGLFGYLYYYEYPQKEIISYENKIDNHVTMDDEKEKDNIYVEVKGAVSSPGVYQLTNDQIINDVIMLAGGFRKDAYTSNINLSKHLSDEMLIYVYTKSEYDKLPKNEVKETQTVCQTEIVNMCIENGDSIIITGENTSVVNKNDLININTASKEELTTLNGIGDAKAQSIIDYRNQNGLFTSIDDILNVSGISQTIYDKIKNYITV